MNVTDLKKLAQAASPGPWYWTPEKDDEHSSGNHGPDLVCAEKQKVWDKWSKDGGDWNNKPELPYVLFAWGHDDWGIEISDADAAYLAAVSPDVVIGLLDRISELETKLTTP